MTLSRHSPDSFQMLEAIRLRSTVTSFGLPSGPGILRVAGDVGKEVAAFHDWFWLRKDRIIWSV
jgi:hypothetical protein